VDELMHGVSTPRVHAEPAKCGQGQHRRPLLRIGLDQEVSAVAVAEWELGEPDDEVPSMVASLRRQA
jgi:hypothetical protein